MNNLTLTTQYELNSTILSNTFIDTYMPQANGDFIKVYIYLLRCVSSNHRNISVSGMADIFNQTEADIMRALKYWYKVGAITLDFHGQNQELSGISFCNLDQGDSPEHTPSSPSSKNDVFLQTTDTLVTIPDSDYTSRSVSDRLSNQNKTVDYISIQSNEDVTPITVESKAPVRVRTTYTPQQIKELSSQDDFSMLLYAVGAYMGGTLNPSEASTIAFFYDTLHFPSDLIEYLVEHCVSKNHKSMRYIEKVACAWADAGISTVKEAKMEISNHSETTYSVMNAFGITNRDPGQRERDYINKWTDLYCFDSDIIIEACNRTLKVTHQPSFEYADSILTKWNSANVKTAEDIKQADAEYELSRNVPKKSSTVVNRSSNRFNNFHQRETDIDSLESSLISNNG